MDYTEQKSPELQQESSLLSRLKLLNLSSDD